MYYLQLWFFSEFFDSKICRFNFFWKTGTCSPASISTFRTKLHLVLICYSDTLWSFKIAQIFFVGLDRYLPSEGTVESLDESRQRKRRKDLSTPTDTKRSHRRWWRWTVSATPESARKTSRPRAAPRRRWWLRFAVLPNNSRSTGWHSGGDEPSSPSPVPLWVSMSLRSCLWCQEALTFDGFACSHVDGGGLVFDLLWRDSVGVALPRVYYTQRSILKSSTFPTSLQHL